MMRILSFVMIALGGLMLMWPVAILAWITVIRLTEPAYQDTYFIVAHGMRLFLYFGTAAALIAGGLWLRRRGTEG